MFVGYCEEIVLRVLEWCMSEVFVSDERILSRGFYYCRYCCLSVYVDDDNAVVGCGRVLDFIFNNYYTNDYFFIFYFPRDNTCLNKCLIYIFVCIRWCYLCIYFTCFVCWDMNFKKRDKREIKSVIDFFFFSLRLD